MDANVVVTHATYAQEVYVSSSSLGGYTYRTDAPH